MLRGLNTYRYDFMHMNERTQRRVDETADRLNKYLDDHGLRDIRFCDMCNDYAREHDYRARITPTDVRGYKNGWWSPKIDKLTLICHATGMPLEYFTGYRAAAAGGGSGSDYSGPTGPVPSAPPVISPRGPEMVASTKVPSSITKLSEDDPRAKKLMTAHKLCRELLADGKVHPAHEVHQTLMKAGYSQRYAQVICSTTMNNVGAKRISKGYIM